MVFIMIIANFYLYSRLFLWIYSLSDNVYFSGNNKHKNKQNRSKLIIKLTVINFFYNLQINWHDSSLNDV